MTYLAIIHGAKGMTYYTYGGTGENHGVTHDPQVWAALKRLSRNWPSSTTCWSSAIRRRSSRSRFSAARRPTASAIRP